MLTHAENMLKLYLKNPSSYTRYDYSVRKYSVHVKDDLYYVPITLEYGATNSFNAMIRSSKTIYVYFRVSKSGIEYIKTEFSAYDKWEMSK